MIAHCGRLLCLFLLTGCAAVAPPTSVPEGPLQFIDLPFFDTQLRQVLGGRPDTVQIVFIDKVKPSQLPARVQPWMTAVRDAGGEVKVVLPPGDLQPRGFPLLSLLPSLWSLFQEQKKKQVVQEPVQGYDAQIIMKYDATGDRLVESIVLNRK